MRHRLILCLALASAVCGCAGDKNGQAKDGWRSLPLVKDGKVHPDWKQAPYGRFVVDDGALKTAPDERGLGLLVYTKEKFGDCQIRVVYRPEKGGSNSGVYVRIDDGILKALHDQVPAASRTEAGTLSPEGAKAMQEASEKELGAWYAVHHGFEVQIADNGDEWHRTGAVYSYAKASSVPTKPAGEWRTMLITLDGNLVNVDLDGQHVTSFDPSSTDIPPRKQWHEPRREHKRPQAGYIGLQNHDPGDLVWFKEVSVRPLNRGR